MQTYNLYCMHPRYGSTFQVVVDASLTAAELIDNLLASGFIQNNRNGYALVWRGQTLANTATLGELPALQNNDVLRVITRQTATDSDTIYIYIQVPHFQSILAIHAHTDWTGEQLIDALWEKGFIYQAESDFLIWKGNKRLEAHQLLNDFGLQSRDLLRITTATSSPTADAPNANAWQQVQTQLTNLQTQMQTLATRSTAVPVQFSPAIEQPYMSIEELVEAILKL